MTRRPCYNSMDISVTICSVQNVIPNPFPPNDIYIYICRTAPLTSRRCILNIYSTSIRDEYFKYVA
jgi:hypothetical protein